MTESDRLGSLSLLAKSFFLDEPLAKHIELGVPIEFAESVVDESINDRCSFVAYDLETNQLVGLCLNEVRLRQSQHSNEQANEKLKFILDILDHMHQSVNLFDEFQTDALLHVFIINVDRSYRGLNLSSRLIAASVEHAKTLNIGGVYAEATNRFSSDPFQRENFRIYHRLNYRDYDQQRLGDLNDQDSSQCHLVAKRI